MKKKVLLHRMNIRDTYRSHHALSVHLSTVFFRRLNVYVPGFGGKRIQPSVLRIDYGTGSLPWLMMEGFSGVFHFFHDTDFSVSRANHVFLILKRKKFFFVKFKRAEKSFFLPCERFMRNAGRFLEPSEIRMRIAGRFSEPSEILMSVAGRISEPSEIPMPVAGQISEPSEIPMPVAGDFRSPQKSACESREIFGALRNSHASRGRLSEPCKSRTNAFARLFPDFSSSPFKRGYSSTDCEKQGKKRFSTAYTYTKIKLTSI